MAEQIPAEAIEDGRGDAQPPASAHQSQPGDSLRRLERGPERDRAAHRMTSQRRAFKPQHVEHVEQRGAILGDRRAAGWRGAPVARQINR